jgi:uncharacterized protein YceH (UPF0502 family)
MVLSAEEGRVLGCLVEKQMITPEYYPMTVNALVDACNQKTNREPVVHYDEATVEQALRDLNDRDGLTKFTRTPGARSLKYVHKAREVLEVDDQQLALLAVLLLRGPQTPGELRSRTDRYVEFDDVASVEEVLEGLIDREVPLVARLERGPGRREDRFRTLLIEHGGPPPDYPTRGADDRLLRLEERIARIEEALGLEPPADG